MLHTVCHIRYVTYVICDIICDISYADVAVMPVIVRIQDINLSYFWDKFPKVANWLSLIQQKDAYSKTFYNGSLLTQKYPHLTQNEK